MAEESTNAGKRAAEVSQALHAIAVKSCGLANA